MWEMWRTCREALACVLYGAHVVHYKTYTYTGLNCECWLNGSI